MRMNLSFFHFFLLKLVVVFDRESWMERSEEELCRFTEDTNTTRFWIWLLAVICILVLYSLASFVSSVDSSLVSVSGVVSSVTSSWAMTSSSVIGGMLMLVKFHSGRGRCELLEVSCDTAIPC